MASGDVKIAYRASVTQGATLLQSQPSSSDYLTVWTGPVVDNSVNLDLDHLIAAKFVTAAAGLAAGEIRMYCVTQLDDTTWPDLFTTGVEGTESASAVIVDTEQLQSACIKLWDTATDTNASRPHSMTQRSLKDALGFMPRKYFLMVAQSTGAALAASGNAVYITGVHETVAP